MTSTKPRNSFFIESLLYEQRRNTRSLDTVELITKKNQTPTGQSLVVDKVCEAFKLQSTRHKEQSTPKTSAFLNAMSQQQFQHILANLAECRQQDASYSTESATTLPQYQNFIVNNPIQALTLSTYIKKCDLLQQAVSLQWKTALNTAGTLPREFVAPSYSFAKHVKESNGRGRAGYISSEKSNIKKYRCDFCNKAFSRSNTLITHKRIHTGEKPFECDHCGRAFRQPGNLTRHRLTHTTVKPYICSFCDKAFNRASNLHTHIRTHANLTHQSVQ